MREANRMVSQILDAVEAAVAPGVTTRELDEIARKKCDEFGVVPAFLGYNGYPFALCCSVNEEVVHGFPSERVLQEGDILSCDMGVIHKRFCGDSARTFPVGAISQEAHSLLKATKQALMLGIEQAVVGKHMYDLSRAIQQHAEDAGYSVVKRFVGHGIGHKLHEKPEVPNFVPRGDSMGLPFKAGMVLAIEPMLCVGTDEVEILDDQWTAITKDRKLSAHFEHSVAIHSTGPEILSVSQE